jgi:hypothetical protein
MRVIDKKSILEAEKDQRPLGGASSYNKQNIQQYEMFYNYCFQYYESQYGFPLRIIPKNLLPNISDAFNEYF